MFFTGKMRYVQLLVLEKDFQKTVNMLGELSWIEIRKDIGGKKEKVVELYDMMDNIEKHIFTINDFLGIKPRTENGNLRDLNEINEYFDELNNLILPYKQKIDDLSMKKKELENGLNEISQFRNLGITRKELEDFTYIHFFIGDILQNDFEKLKESYGSRFVETRLNENLYVFFTSKKNRWTIESELKKLSFKERKLSSEAELLPREIFEKLSLEIEELNKKIEEIDAFKNEIVKKELKSIHEYSMSFNLQKVFQNVYQTVKHSDSISSIEGWILKKKVPKLIDNLKKLLHDNFSFVSFDPEELDEVRKGVLQVPVVMENIFFLKPFESLVFNYGIPSYKSFDPTLFVTFTFLLFFGMMYGDMGQGFVIFLAGMILQRLKKFRDFGVIVTSIGITAMLFGYLYGSFFCFEYKDLTGILTPINKSLFRINHPYIINLSPENSLNIFMVTIGFGVVVNLFGMLINIVNAFIKKRVLNILFNPTGFAGFILLFSIAVIGVDYIILNRTPGNIWSIIIMVCLFLIFLNEPLTNIVTRKKPVIHEKFTSWLLFSVIELFEVVLNIISNNLSFIRIGAFAYAHTVLSMTTMEFSRMLGGLTSIGGITILLVGNIIIIGLEGMIVAIQTIRLEYYEFFSKFFHDLGRQFVPFKIEKFDKLGVSK